MREFKFFRGIKSTSNITTNEIEDFLINELTEDIRRGVNEEITRLLTTRVNGGRNNNLQYLNHYINMGGGNRA